MTNWDDVAALPPEERPPIYRAYLKDHPKDPGIWFDLGLAFKQLRDWQACIDANRHALEISSAPEEPAWWNLGIAATAVPDWDLARRAWRGYGLEMPEGVGPIECDYGSTPVRLPHGEIVWGPRIDPARVVIRNIPVPGSEYRWGDIVLHDGAPNGERDIDGVRYSVFDVLERWSPSEIPTLTTTVRCEDDTDAHALIDIFEARGFAAEDWTANVRNLCRACSQGLPSTHEHPHLASDADREFGLASPKGLAQQLLSDWKAAAPSRRDYGVPAFL